MEEGDCLGDLDELSHRYYDESTTVTCKVLVMSEQLERRKSEIERKRVTSEILKFAAPEDFSIEVSEPFWGESKPRTIMVRRGPVSFFSRYDFLGEQDIVAFYITSKLGNFTIHCDPKIGWDVFDFISNQEAISLWSKRGSIIFCTSTSLVFKVSEMWVHSVEWYDFFDSFEEVQKEKSKGPYSALSIYVDVFRTPSIRMPNKPKPLD